MKLGDNDITPSQFTEFDAPLSPAARKDAAKGGNPSIEKSRCAIAVPEGFDPKKPWPVLAVSSTTDGAASSVGAMKQFQPTANRKGWVVIAADGPQGKPPSDGSDFRFGVLSGALDMMRKSWPGSEKWPFAAGGFSGGAKNSGFIGAMLMRDKYKLIGMFMGGCNQDMATAGFNEYHPGAHFKKVPIFLSSGKADQIARPEQTENVKKEMERSGFKNVRLESYAGGHHVDAPHVELALDWFREMASKNPAPPAGSTGAGSFHQFFKR